MKGEFKIGDLVIYNAVGHGGTDLADLGLKGLLGIVIEIQPLSILKQEHSDVYWLAKGSRFKVWNSELKLLERCE